MSLDWKAIVRSVAPGIGAALAGPLGAAAGKLLGTALLGREDATEAELATAIGSATPADLIKLKELDLQFQRDMKALGIDVFRLEVEDRKSAREMFRVTIWPQLVLSVVYHLVYAVVLFYLFTSPMTDVSEFQKGALTMLLGGLTTGVATIMAFWFGSTMGSKEKTAALAASAPASGQN